MGRFSLPFWLASRGPCGYVAETSVLLLGDGALGVVILCQSPMARLQANHGGSTVRCAAGHTSPVN